MGKNSPLIENEDSLLWQIFTHSNPFSGTEETLDRSFFLCFLLKVPREKAMPPIKHNNLSLLQKLENGGRLPSTPNATLSYPILPAKEGFCVVGAVIAQFSKPNCFCAFKNRGRGLDCDDETCFQQREEERHEEERDEIEKVRSRKVYQIL